VGSVFLKKKEKQNYGKNSKAFREVLATYRQSLAAGLIQAKEFSGGGKGAARDQARPSLSDFRCDVDIAVRSHLKGVTVEQFKKAYVDYDSEDEIESNQHALKILGGKHWSVTQRVGNAFVKAGLFRDYFHTVRHTPYRTWIAGSSVVAPYRRNTSDPVHEQLMTILYEQTQIAAESAAA
jgi:hypothetical protein